MYIDIIHVHTYMHAGHIVVYTIIIVLMHSLCVKMDSLSILCSTCMHEMLSNHGIHTCMASGHTPFNAWHVMSSL